ncbi:hypothetical protein ABT120_38130 [Nonomuraea angiospora]|uniref:fascin domain-containing protein n=1 Tax=Nonomuraea angiospora TaxID=46172 RepID=UPI00332D801A
MVKRLISGAANQGVKSLSGTASTLGLPTGSAPSGTISLRSRANNMYVTAENAGAQPLTANRTTVGGWEQFDRTDLGNGNIALKARANGKYVTAESAGAQPLIANRDAIGPWESFDLITS